MARKHTGNIYQRKEGGAFYADYYSGGRRVREALIGDDGKPVFDKATAEALLAARMYRLNAPTASQQIEGLENERRTIEEKAALAAAEEERRRQESTWTFWEAAHQLLLAVTLSLEQPSPKVLLRGNFNRNLKF